MAQVQDKEKSMFNNTPDYYLKRKDLNKSRQINDPSYQTGHYLSGTPDKAKAHQRSYSTRLQPDSANKKMQNRKAYDDKQQALHKQKLHKSISQIANVLPFTHSQSLQLELKQGKTESRNHQQSEKGGTVCNSTAKINYVKRGNNNQEKLQQQNTIYKLPRQSYLDKTILSASQSVRSLRNQSTIHANIEDSMFLQQSDISFFNNVPNQQSPMVKTNTGRVQRLFQKKTVMMGERTPKVDKRGRNSKSRQAEQRSLSKSLSEKKLRTAKVNDDLSEVMNKTQTQFLSYSNSKNVERHTGMEMMESGMKLMQQETPRSSNLDNEENNNDGLSAYKGRELQGSVILQQMMPDLIKTTHKIELEVTLDTLKSLQNILEFLLQEEERLNVYSAMVSQGQLLELQSQLPMLFRYQYLDLISSVECKKERPKFFAQQLQVSLIVTNTLVQIFTATFLQKYSHKLRTVYQNIHQNFLLLVDQVLNCCHANPKENLTYILLRKLTIKKIKNKQKSQRLTQLRQNNEVNLLIIKKICRSMTSTTTQTPSQNVSFEQTQQYFYSELSQMSNEILEILRTYDRLDIPTIITKLSFKDEIIKKKNQLLLQSPSKRAKTAYKSGSPRQSPRVGFSPTNSNKSGRNSETSSQKGRKLDNKPKRVKLVKPTFDCSQNKSAKAKKPLDNDSQYDVIDDFNHTTSSLKTAKEDPKQQQTGQVITSAFSLPETMQFILTNSVENNNGITNINNTINIYSTANVDHNQLKNLIQDPHMSQFSSKLSSNPSSKIPAYSGSKPPISSKVQGSQSPAQTKLTTKSRPISGIGSGTQNLAKRTQSRQMISRENSNLQIDAHLDSSKLGLSRESSAISQKGQVQKNLVVNNSPNKKKAMAFRPQSRQAPAAKDNYVNSRKNSGISLQASSITTNRKPQTKSMIKSATKKVGLNLHKDGSVSDLNSDITISSLNCTPMKKNTKIENEKITSSQQKKHGATILQSASKKLSIAQANTNLKKKQMAIAKQNQGSRQNNVQHNFSPSKNASSSKYIASERIKKESSFLKEQMNSSKLNIIGFEVNSSNDDLHNQEFYTEQKIKQRTSLLNQTETIQSTTHKSKHEADEIFARGESRLDQLLNEMVDQSPRQQLQQQKIEEQPMKAQMIQFGSLIEQHIGSFDLKREMEKLKQLDQEQKMQKRISLKITHANNTGASVSGAESQASNTPKTGHQRAQTSESPSKRIFLGEFDETKDEDYQNLNLGDDLLLSNESNKNAHEHHKQVAIEVFDFSDYITQKTGIEDPFPDHQDPNEEKSSSVNKPNDTKTKEDDQKKRDDEEFQKLKAQVSIPYLPSVDQSEMMYTLVLDLDETLIHLECDDDAQDEEEQVYYLIRPGAIKFLNELSKYFELVIFTAAMPDYADWILDNVDRHRIIKHRLYRQHTSPHEDYAIKDLRNLGRPLERTIIIDNLAENFIHTTPENGIWVESWYDDMDDTVLEMLVPFLKDLVVSQVDVRQVLSKEIKENIIYRCLEEGKDIPSVRQLLSQSQ